MVSTLLLKQKKVKENPIMTEDEQENEGAPLMVAVDNIFSNPSQPRRIFEDEAIRRLAESIRRYGIIQPLTVREKEGFRGGRRFYELVAGERRLRAAKLLKLREVPCVVVRADGCRSAEMAIVENLMREDLNIFEQAAALASLIGTYNLTQEQIAKSLACSQSYVANKLRLLNFTRSHRELILKHQLTERHARALLRVRSEEERGKLLKLVIARGLNVARTEELVERYLADSKAEKPAPTPDKGQRIMLREVKLFYNSVKRAVDLIRGAGVAVESTRTELEDVTEILIRIPKERNEP